MDSSVGNMKSAWIRRSGIVSLITFFALGAQEPQLLLRVVDHNNIPIKEAVVGYRYKIELLATGITQSLPTITIPGSEQFQTFGREMQMRTVNGESSATHRLNIKVEKPGEFLLGPVEIVVNGKAVQSKSCVVRVVADTAAAQKSRARAAQEADELDVFARLSLNKKRAVIGEKIEATLRFYVCGAPITVSSIVKPECTECTMGAYREPLSGREVIKGKSYGYLEWSWDVYATQEGSITIPAYLVEYDIPQRTSSHNGLFHSLFGMPERKRVYSNAASLVASALPPTDQAVQAVGVCKRLNARIQPAVIKEGEAAVLTLELEGDADLDALTTPPLVDMPSGLKWYASKATTHAPTQVGGCAVRAFEYIVQGVSAGDHIIPAQSFFCFDTHKHAYCTLESTPISIAVAVAARQAAPIRAGSVDALSPDERAELAQDSLGLAPLDVGDPCACVPSYGMPWWLFAVLAIIPSVFFGGRALRHYRATVRSRHAPYYRRMHAYATARAALKKAQKLQQPMHIYAIMLTFFASRVGSDAGPMSQELIHRALHNADVAPAQLHAWDLYFTRIAHVAFESTSKPQPTDSLFEEGFMWLAVFEKKL
jgi:hypothetical protein